MVISHPLIAEHLTKVRDAETPSDEFRRRIGLIGQLMAFEVTKHIETRDVSVQTPLGSANGQELTRPIVLVPILRAGLGMMEGMLASIPQAKIGHIGMVRDEKTHRPTTYCCKLPPDMAEADVILIDPMLATGHSGADATTILKEKGANRLTFVSLVSAPEGIKHFEETHPDVPMFTAAIDSHLDENAYIFPGLGDAGDRCFGT